MSITSRSIPIRFPLRLLRRIDRQKAKADKIPGTKASRNAVVVQLCEIALNAIDMKKTER